MTKKQAFLTAVSGGTPDVVPVAPLIHCRYANKLLGRYGWKDVFEVHQKLGSCHHRGPIGIGWTSVPTEEGVGSESRVIAETPEGRKTTEWIINTPKKRLVGETVVGAIPHDPLVGKTTVYPVKSKEDWLAYRDYLRLSVEAGGQPYLGTVEEAVATMGEEGMPSVGLGPAYTSLGAVRGMEGLIMDFYDHPDLIKELLEMQRVIMRGCVEGFIKSSTPVAWLDICWATGSGLSPEMFEQWAMPDVYEAMAIVKQHPGKYMGLYTLGKIGQFMPMFADAGVSFVSTFEPNEGDMSLREAKQKFGKKMALFGNFDCLVLAFGTVQDAKKEARRCLDEAMEGGGYVMVTADEVPADAQWDNLKAMVETVQEYGRY
jgi:uroporphyrinogen-III decarboxylase